MILGAVNNNKWNALSRGLHERHLAFLPLKGFISFQNIKLYGN